MSGEEVPAEHTLHPTFSTVPTIEFSSYDLNDFLFPGSHDGPVRLGLSLSPLETHSGITSRARLMLAASLPTQLDISEFVPK